MAELNKEEKAEMIETSFQLDKLYLQALDCLREEMTSQGIDIDNGEGRKTFIRAVRKLNEKLSRK